VAKIGNEKKTISPLTDYEVNFIDRQKLMQLEEMIVDLEVILDSLSDSIDGICKQCQRCCQTFCSNATENCVCGQILDELNLCTRHIDVDIRRAGFLQKKVKATARLVRLRLSNAPLVDLLLSKR